MCVTNRSIIHNTIYATEARVGDLGSPYSLVTNKFSVLSVFYIYYFVLSFLNLYYVVNIVPAAVMNL